MDKPKRETKISNEILKNLLLDNNTIQIKLFLMILNKAISKHYAVMKNNYGEVDEIDREVTLSMEFINKYKGSKRLTTRELLEFMNEIDVRIRFEEKGEKIRVVNVLSSVEFDDYEFTIKFNKDAIKYLILIANNYSVIDLEILKNLTGKYEIGLYVMDCMYNNLKSRTRIFAIDDFKKFIGINVKKNNDMTRRIDKAILKLKDENINLSYSVKKTGNKISHLVFEMESKPMERKIVKSEKKLINTENKKEVEEDKKDLGFIKDWD